MANRKKVLRRNKLLKKLFYTIAKNELKNYDIYKFIKFEIKNEFNSGCRTDFIYNIIEKNHCIKSIKITYGVIGIKRDISEGYSNFYSYYKNRGNFINKHILGNKRKAVLFIFYHELYHAKKRLYGKHYSGNFEELQADNFAIDKIKNI